MRSLKNFKASASDTAEKPGDKPMIPEKYAGMSEDMLRAELLSKVAEAKSDGSFDSQKIDEFVETVSPSLDEATRARLKDLVALIKG